MIKLDLDLDVDLETILIVDGLGQRRGLGECDAGYTCTHTG